MDLVVQMPTMPRATRSARRRAKIVKDNQMSAFDLLATVAGNLLQDKEISTNSSCTSSEKDQYGFVVEESQNTNTPLKAEPSDEGSCDRRYRSDHSSQACDQNMSLTEIGHSEKDDRSGIASKLTDFSLPNGKSHNPMEILVSDNNVPCSSLSRDCDNVPVDSRDDDEKCFRFIDCSTRAKSFRSTTCLGDRRIRKLLASKYWKVSSELNDDKLLDRDGNLKPIYNSRKNCYKRQRSEMNVPFKKRKPCDHRSVSNSDGFIKMLSQDASGSSPMVDGDTGTSSLKAHQSTGLHCRDSHVKLRIKSFRVPELFIEIPETATIGSLKRTVMEAVTSILGGGLNVGVILQGKKVRDDNKTLIQTGIYQDDDHLDALGFTLEPNSLKGLQSICAVDSPLVPNADMPSCDMDLKHQVTSLCKLVESDHDSAPPPISTPTDTSMTYSKALAAISVIPMNPKTKQSEAAQRRIRRPFSVDEVEALVQAVEKLGTGRWRDVKLCAFDNAEHRTYVDLKDKWKTLVHTARISPQQRRGQPVPQELLDRVLTAHHYWSHHHTKQHVAGV